MTVRLATSTGILPTTVSSYFTQFSRRELPAREPRRLLTDPTVAKLTLPRSEVVVEVYQPEPQWFYPALDRLQHLSRLDDNWDSYGGSPPADQAVFTALALMVRILRDDSMLPSIVPTSDGGVQLEWHGEGEELEIRVNPDGEISAFRFDEQAGQGNEVDHVTLPDLSLLLALTGRR